MSTERVGITQITTGDIEFLRNMRNSYVGTGVFQADRIISPDEQEKWFSKLDQNLNFYFLVEDKALMEQVGYTSLIVDPQSDNKIAEIGIILKKGVSSPLISFHSKMLTLAYGFEQLRLNEVKAVFHPQNQAAIRFNKAFGFIFSETLPSGFVVNHLSSKAYFSTKEPLMKKFRL